MPSGQDQRANYLLQKCELRDKPRTTSRTATVHASSGVVHPEVAHDGAQNLLIRGDPPAVTVVALVRGGRLALARPSDRDRLARLGQAQTPAPLLQLTLPKVLCQVNDNDNDNGTAAVSATPAHVTVADTHTITHRQRR